MPMQFACPSCGRSLRMGEELLGTLVRCPSCNHEFVADESLRAEITTGPARDYGPSPPPAPADDPRIREGEPPPRPAGLPRFDAYEDDEDYERERLKRRWQRDDDVKRILERVRRPAANLVILGWICVVLGGLLVMAHVLILMAGVQARGRMFVSNEAVPLIRTSIHLVIAILIIVGGENMKRLNNLGLAKAAAIIAMIPLVSPCCILGLPFGWGALRVLNDPEVASAFGKGGRVYDD